MSHAANIYVKKLKAAPNGDVIPASERALLWYLADCHSEEAGGIAWPSMKTLAEHADVTTRHARRLITSLEKKGIIGCIAQARENGSQQSNSFYFVELQALPIAPATRFLPCAKPKKNGGKHAKNGGKPVGKPVDAAPPPLTPMSPPHDTHVRGTLTPMSPLEAPIEASIETPAEQATATTGDGDPDFLETTSKAKTARACVNPTAPPHPGKWDAFKSELLRRLEMLPEKIREGCVAEFNALIRDTSLIDDACDGDSMVPTWTISSVDPEATRHALAGLASSVKAALWKTAKCDVQVQVYGGME